MSIWLVIDWLWKVGKMCSSRSFWRFVMHKISQILQYFVGKTKLSEAQKCRWTSYTVTVGFGWLLKHIHASFLEEHFPTVCHISLHVNEQSCRTEYAICSVCRGWPQEVKLWPSVVSFSGDGLTVYLSIIPHEWVLLSTSKCSSGKERNKYAYFIANPWWESSNM